VASHSRENAEVPTVITIVAEQLPRNASGTILKRQLRDSIVESA
jgi:acyl-CoA synthetase (AMP-forming)/AMP-acid ligase II